MIIPGPAADMIKSYSRLYLRLKLSTSATNNLKLPRYFIDIWAPKVFTILILRRFGSPMGLPNRRAWRGEATEALARAWDGVAA